jgi:hypothetical protein
MSSEEPNQGPTDGGAQGQVEPVQISQNEGAIEAPEAVQVQPQETQETQEPQTTPNPVRVYVVRQMFTLPKAFQLLIDGYIVKISMGGRIVDCGAYMSRSGLTWAGCYRWNGEELRDTRGLYIIKDGRELSLTNNAKLFRDLKEYEAWLTDTLKGLFAMELIPEKVLIAYNNYGFNVYSRYEKAITLEMSPYYAQGHLQLYRIPEPEAQIEPEEKDGFEIYNHNVRFSAPVKVAEAETYGTGVAVLLYVSDNVVMNVESPDHGSGSPVLGPGWYLMVHPRPRGGAD